MRWWSDIYAGGVTYTLVECRALRRLAAGGAERLRSARRGRRYGRVADDRHLQRAVC